MGFFDTYKPRINKEEWKQLRTTLVGKGLLPRKLADIEKVFSADMDEPRDIDKGIDAEELERGITWLRSHKSIHSLTDGEIDLVESEFKKKI